MALLAESIIKGSDQRSHQLHTFAAGDEQTEKHLAFRDYLIEHPVLAKQYVPVKHNDAGL
ncbi:GrpB family protein [Pantoea sp. BAV 3049]|uniref:GrpB family protein n=1 Tax=Pantoea sp. BAV 3049 TaxID=2654188 RepID=UPI00131AF0E4